MRKHFFRSKFIMFITLTLVPICIFGFILVFFINMQVKKEAVTKTTSTSALIEQYMDELTNTLELYRVTVNSDTNLHLALVSVLGSPVLTTEPLKRMEQSMQSIYYSLSSKPYIQSLYVTMENSPYFINGLTREAYDQATDSSWMQTYQKEITDRAADSDQPFSNSRILTVRNIKKYKFDTSTIPVITVYQRMKYNEIMAINIRQDYFSRWLDSITAYHGQALFLLNDKNEILFFNDNTASLPGELLSHALQSDETVTAGVELDGYYLSKRSLSGPYGMSYLSLIPKNEVFRLPNSILGLTIAAACASILLSSLLAYIFTDRDYRQLSQIIDLFDQAEKGCLKTQELYPVKTVNNNAYFHIINNVIRLFMSQTYLNLQLDAKKYALATAQLSALQYQLNPHFLFNTLQSIDLEVLKIGKTPTPANQMITELSQLLRYSLNEPMKYVTVQEEISMTKYYIDLQMRKYGSYFDVTWEYTEEVLPFPMLRLLLQPLIENAIVHSGKTQPEKLWVKIKIVKKGRQLIFTVIDNGYGMDKEKTEELRKRTAEDTVDTSGRHIGLANLSQRIRLAYEHSFIKISSRPGWGTIITYGFQYEE